MGAIFILAILAMISAFVVNISAISHSTTSYALEGSRALFAARSGLEWGTQQVVATPTACPATTTLSLTEGGISGFTVVVSCATSNYSEGVTNFNVFEISSFASRGSFGSIDYVSREMKVYVTIGS